MTVTGWFFIRCNAVLYAAAISVLTIRAPFSVLHVLSSLFSWLPPSPRLQPPHRISLEGENKLESVQQRRKEKLDLRKKHSPCWLILRRITMLEKKRWGLVTVCSGEVSVAIRCWFWTRWLLCSHWLVMGSNTFFMLFYQKKNYLRLIEIIQWLFQCALFVTNDNDVLLWVKLTKKIQRFFYRMSSEFYAIFYCLLIFWDSFMIYVWTMYICKQFVFVTLKGMRDRQDLQQRGPLCHSPLFSGCWAGLWRYT